MPARHSFLPYLLAASGVGLFALMDGLMKHAALMTGAYTATLLRSLIGAALIAPLWLARRPRWPRGRLLRLHIERGVVTAAMALTWFFALTRLPLAEALAISFVAPLITLYFAHLLLGEAISRRAILASLLGFAGALVIVAGRIHAAGMTRDLALGLAAMACSALCYAYSFIVIRRQSQLAGPIEVATFHAGIGGLVLLLGAPFAFTMPAIPVLGVIGLAGALTVLGSMAIAWAYARAETQALVPLEYTGFVWAAWIGWQWFDERVTLATLLGLGMIVAGSWIVRPRGPVPAL
ncbi:DMT family transporter [Aurantiacibacter xanthus]|uniref:DMT family transporter n=1 Tax=Aurantiacibacter xanthus TaxID=1784712 RepID=A0A3A1P5Q7_9SPHN|nr:DMT family transporter [Aurantiacibacter xanthus]RIV86272.1 DMT family transporter [Aurantiacibacter xanthus]